MGQGLFPAAIFMVNLGLARETISIAKWTVELQWTTRVCLKMQHGFHPLYMYVLSSLFHLTKHDTRAEGSGLIKVICDAYQGQDKPKACNKKM